MDNEVHVPEEDRVIEAKEAMSMLGISSRVTLYNWVREGKLRRAPDPSFKERSPLNFHLSEVERFMAQRRAEKRAKWGE